MKSTLYAASALLLGGFAVCATGCATGYSTTPSVPTYSRTILPAASRVALVMEFRGGEPTPQERAEVRALLADYLAGKGSVLVDDTGAADYLVHAVLERQNPDNAAEWTVVNTYSARSLSTVSGDDYQWPDGIIEDESYETTTFAYVGFGVFFPICFDLWDSPWHRGHVIVRPPPRADHRYWESSWRAERRWHRPDRWRHADGPGFGRDDYPRRGDDHRAPPMRPPDRDNDRDRRRADDRDRHRGIDGPRSDSGHRPAPPPPRNEVRVTRPSAPPPPQPPPALRPLEQGRRGPSHGVIPGRAVDQPPAPPPRVDRANPPPRGQSHHPELRRDGPRHMPPPSRHEDSNRRRNGDDRHQSSPRSDSDNSDKDKDQNHQRH